ncbi:MAG: Cas9 inhibitor AcrIIA9 family protein [Bacillota bacterium]|nr:Cas9 inhibitor AcrIIA9 family protein [Bacillota bacterium]
MSLWSLLDEDEKKEPEKVKEVKKEVEQVADQQPAPVAGTEKQATEEQKQATVQATEVVEEPKKEEKPAGKKKPAKEKKPQTLEEQIATVPDNLKTPIDRIFKYLMSVPGMDEKMRNPKKSITDMWQFVESNARKQATGNTACIEDEVVYGWAVHYYDEDDPK